MAVTATASNLFGIDMADKTYRQMGGTIFRRRRKKIRVTVLLAAPTAATLLIEN